MKTLELHTLLQDSILTSEPLINPYLQNPPKGTVADRVAIYTDGYYARLEETLLNDYETLAAILGEKKFSSLCSKYLAAYPSYNPSLNFFGKHMSTFLREQVPYNKKPYLAEIAAFEWTEYQAMVAANAKILNAAYLQAVPVDQWSNLKFHLHPSASILTLHYNSLAMIKSHRANKIIPKPIKSTVPKSMLIWRRQQEILFCKLDSSERILINAIKNQANFGEICEKLSQVLPEEEVAQYLVKELHAWLREELFIGDGSGPK